ncbi:3-hydroxybutyryl-CoA dehydrogenase [Bradyrhizobium sp. CCBAU 53338]|uniref:3-hydroxybutyryl-CoA dehydrogenase n=1 Tax=Bradyrhizobium sp. CCBAU 53338 TaxID=1325111 RepID=UPI00188A2688|nr:3-hydroxybutyryl-CoA dehydrogenase [Bradyrhizobium sp. CCBAU 53338]QOZ52504.1 3-hydroxybutyryl-CoA dehydrogenase [Bradyrhizobium sp. CCBAU 53338]
MSGTVSCVGAGRMGRGIATVFAYAGYSVRVVDFKERSKVEFDRVAAEVKNEIKAILEILVRIGLMPGDTVPIVEQRVTVLPATEAAMGTSGVDLIFECLPEILELKRQQLALISRSAAPQTIIASTTSTIMVDDIAGAIDHPDRFLNVHWLNPAYLVPLVEMSAGRRTSGATVSSVRKLLEDMGKVPVLCASRPGFIVPRIQGLAMNEAARIVEEGVASAEDVEKAVKYGFGFRFGVLGLLEFIDWGGGDILHFASKYLTEALEHPRYASPEIVSRNVAEGRIGMKTRKGFLDYEGVDLESYREQRLGEFAGVLRRMKLDRGPVV